MVTVTYRQLTSLDSDTFSAIEGYTGSQQFYGVDTPINVLDIIDNVSLATGIECLLFANTFALCQTLAIACIQADIDSWNTAFPGDPRLSNLLTEIELYIASANTVVEPKLDYCGDPIPGFYGEIPINRLTDEYNSILESVSALSSEGVNYAFSAWMTQLSPWSPAAISYLEDTPGVTIDPQYQNTVNTLAVQAQSLPDTATVNIHDTLSANPNAFIQQSAQYDAQVNDTTYYGILYHQVWAGAPSPPVNYEALALQMLVNQIGQLLYMLENGVNLLPGIVTGVSNAISQYASAQIIQLGPQMQELQAYAISNSPILAATNPTEQAIINAGLTAQSNVLSDPSFIASFSSNGTTLTPTEQANLENGARTAALAAQQSAAASALISIQAEYNSYANLNPDSILIGVITPYLL